MIVRFQGYSIHTLHSCMAVLLLNKLLFCFTVLPEIAALLYPVNITRSFQETHIFICQALGGPINNIFYWTFNNFGVTNADITSTSLESTLTISNLTASDGGEYTCTVSNLAGNAANSSTLHVSPYIVTNPNETLTAVNETQGLELECVAEAFPSPTYTWTQLTGPPAPRTVVDDSDSGLLAFSPVLRFDDYGTYVCTASSNGLMVNSSVSTVYGKSLWFCVLLEVIDMCVCVSSCSLS